MSATTPDDLREIIGLTRRTADPYSDKPVKFKQLTSRQLRDLHTAKETGRLSWRSAFTLKRRGLVEIVDHPSVLEILAGLRREVKVTAAGEEWLAR